MRTERISTRYLSTAPVILDQCKLYHNVYDLTALIQIFQGLSDYSLFQLTFD
jgi:hypothetical protein